MSAVATRERHPGGLERGSAKPPAQRLFATWRDLTNADSATCPVCSGEMSRAGGCTSCGTVLD
jgi:hypothetical protein